MPIYVSDGSKARKVKKVYIGVNGVAREVKFGYLGVSSKARKIFESVKKFTVTFNANSGSCTETSRTVSDGSAIGTLPTATRSGYRFDGWFTASSGGTQITTSTTITADTTIYAHWSQYVTLTFNANGGTCSETSRTVAAGDALGTLPTPTKSSATFGGWYTSTSGGTQITSSSTISADTTIYARWTNKYTVTFNANGGTCSETSRTVVEGNAIGTLPTATYSGQVFGGWYTAASGGLKVDSSYSVSSNVILYARWGASSDVTFGEATTEFNMQYEGDRTNYNNNPYTLYSRIAGGASGTANLTIQTGISSTNGTANMTSTNTKVILYLKVTNNGDAGSFDIGFDCDSYVSGSDSVVVTRISNGLQLGPKSSPYYKVTVPYTHTAWCGSYSSRTSNRYVEIGVGTSSSGDSGYAFTMNDIFINNGSYTILEVTFQKL